MCTGIAGESRVIGKAEPRHSRGARIVARDLSTYGSLFFWSLVMSRKGLVFMMMAFLCLKMPLTIALAEEKIPLVAKLRRTVVGVGKSKEGAEGDADAIARNVSGGSFVTISSKPTGSATDWDCTLVFEYTPVFSNEQLELFKNKAPRFVIVSSIEKDQLKFITYVEKNVPIPFEFSELRDGKSVKQTKMIDRLAIQIEEQFVDLSDCRITTADGKDLAKEDLSRIKNKPAFLAADHEGIASLYLQMLKSDTYIINLVRTSK